MFDPATLDLSPKQIKVLQCANHRWNILSGAVRSGKTFISGNFLLPKGIATHYDDNIAIIGKTVNTVDRNVLDPLREAYGDDISPLKDKKEVYIFGKKCYVFGANDERAITKIQGVGLGYAYGDEMTTWPENFFNMLKSRLDRQNSQCDGTCNPDSPSHFLKQFIDNKVLDIYNEPFTIYDNPFLASSFIHNLEEEYRGTIYFDRWILGKWIKSEGLVYPLFKRDRHYLTPDEYGAKFGGGKRIRYVIWGGDGATTNDATVLVPLAVLENGQSVVLEIFYQNPKENGAMANEQLVTPIREYLDWMENKYRFSRAGVKHYMPVDAAAADLVMTLRYHFPEYLPVSYGKKNILQTTDVVNNAFARNAVCVFNYGGYYNFVRHRQVNTVSPLVVDLENMIWNKDNDGYDDTIPNDAADAFRYAVNTYYYNPENLWETPDANISYELAA
jgi:Phage terminase large subunit